MLAYGCHKFARVYLISKSGYDECVVLLEFLHPLGNCLGRARASGGEHQNFGLLGFYFRRLADGLFVRGLSSFYYLRNLLRAGNVLVGKESCSVPVNFLYEGFRYVLRKENTLPALEKGAECHQEIPVVLAVQNPVFPCVAGKMAPHLLAVREKIMPCPVFFCRPSVLKAEDVAVLS